MVYKHSCVVDTNAIYKTLVLVLLVENEDHQQEEQIQHYEMLEGEMLVDMVPPTMRPYAGAAGFIRPKRQPMRRRLLPGKPSTLRLNCLRESRRQRNVSPPWREPCLP